MTHAERRPASAFSRKPQKARLKALEGRRWGRDAQFHGSAALTRSWAVLGADFEVCRRRGPPVFLCRRFFSDVQRQSENPLVENVVACLLR
jgi:hypothetical protein